MAKYAAAFAAASTLIGNAQKLGEKILEHKA
jgi:hypothetical protein